MTGATTLQARADRADRVRAELGAIYDRQMAPMGLAAMDALAPAPGETIIDVGCGAGETIAQLAERVGPHGRVIGVDIGRHVLAVAAERTAHLANVDLRLEDAAILDLPDGSVDALYSRFGASFFSDPVAAFAHLRRLLRPGGRITFVCWRSLQDNEIDHWPLTASGVDRAFDPASHSFERADVIDQVLRAAGFREIVVAPSDIQVSVGGVEKTLRLVTRVGPLGMILREDPDLRSTVEPKVRMALQAREKDNRIAFSAATWIVSAKG